MVRLELPWPARGERATASSDGIDITLEDARRSEENVTLRLRVEHPEGSPPTWNLGAAAGPVVLLDRRGKTLPFEPTRFFISEFGSRYQVLHFQGHGTSEAP